MPAAQADAPTGLERRFEKRFIVFAVYGDREFSLVIHWLVVSVRNSGAFIGQAVSFSDFIAHWATWLYAGETTDQPGHPGRYRHLGKSVCLWLYYMGRLTRYASLSAGTVYGGGR